MALSPQKPLVAKSITQSMREVIDDLQFAIKSSHRTIEDCREAIAAANEILAQHVPDKPGPLRR
jgi:hypothetical protein